MGNFNWGPISRNDIVSKAIHAVTVRYLFIRCKSIVIRHGLKLRLVLVLIAFLLLFHVHGKHLRSCRGGQLT